MTGPGAESSYVVSETAVALDRSDLVSFSNLNWGRLPYGVGTLLLCAETLMTAARRLGSRMTTWNVV